MSGHSEFLPLSSVNQPTVNLPVVCLPADDLDRVGLAVSHQAKPY